jgi:TonB family protein
MFEVLIESGVHSVQSAGPRLTSILVHGGLVVLAAAGFRTAGSAVPLKPVAVPIDIYAAPTQPAGPRGGGAQSSPGTVLAPPPATPLDVPTVVPPVTMPMVTPQPGVTARELAGRELRGRQLVGPASEAQVLLAGEVDEPVVVLIPPRLVYPQGMAAAGIGGEVRVEFVVDTAGRCEPASVRVVSSTNPAFEASARTGVCEATYRPGRVRGKVVRQLVQQKVAFRQR